ncbi:MAG TPA: riboflavin biosynthesis protein RibF [Pirellulaceae bacterium]|nr:riboflavin biosynthesis protein RibF [Pirellulaceae bacterium]HMO93392.1 riboflavin biosynthesis protein RibF [Pirellulaceae bacterium]HMP70452.1 riboflavin biosynthesis protein RibF [Pirellulaceae bacterium]
MKLIRKLASFPSHLRGGALTIGNFDGVHLGHAHLISRLKSHAELAAGPAIVFTFDPHPVRILNQAQAPAPLTWTDRKAELLGLLGVDIVIAYPTNLQFLELNHTEFFEQVVMREIGARTMVEGPNFFFGKSRTGDVVALHQLCDSHGIELDIVEPIKIGNEFISSSRIRKLIASGEVATAGTMLTQAYRIRGLVTHGAARGTSLGFPTANLAGVDTLVPNHGVYAGRAWVENTSRLAAIHIGPSPTFNDVPKIEVHLLDFEGSLYGRTLEVEFLNKIRDILKFDDTRELQKQIDLDIQQIRQVAGGNLKQVI